MTVPWHERDQGEGRRRAAGRGVRGAAARYGPEQGVLRLQGLAGNRAVQSLLAGRQVAVPVQRHLKATGDKKDVAAMLGMLGPASGLTLAHDPKTTLVSATASAKKPLSPALAGRLQAIVDDPKRDAEVHLGRKQAGVSFGAFPTTKEDLANKPVQELRIDQFLALEKGVPGAGVVKLAHEIVENHEAHSHQDELWQVAFGMSHDAALKAEGTVQDEMQTGRGEKLSGARRNSFKFVTGTGKTQQLRWIEAHENDFLVWDESFDGKNTVSNAKRVGKARVGMYTVDAFTSTTALPKGADASLQPVAAVLKKDRTASVLLEGFSRDAKTLRDAADWYELVRDRVGELVGDIEAGAWDRFHLAPAAVGSSNRMVITVDRPQLP